jgi:hypothetical protein
VPRGLLLLRTSTVRSYRVGHAKHSRKYFEDDATVEYPQKIPDQCGEQREQSLHRGLLEASTTQATPAMSPMSKCSAYRNFNILGVAYKRKEKSVKPSNTPLASGIPAS